MEAAIISVRYESHIGHSLETNQGPATRRARQARPGISLPNTSSFSSPASTPASTPPPSAVTSAAPATASGPPSTPAASPRASSPLRKRSPCSTSNWASPTSSPRATARADELTDDELRAGGKRLASQSQTLVAPPSSPSSASVPTASSPGSKTPSVGLQQRPLRRHPRLGPPQPQRPQRPLPTRRSRQTLRESSDLGHRTPRATLKLELFAPAPGGQRPIAEQHSRRRTAAARTTPMPPTTARNPLVVEIAMRTLTRRDRVEPDQQSPRASTSARLLAA